MSRKIFILIFIVSIFNCFPQNNSFNKAAPKYKLTSKENSFLDSVQHGAFLYFIDEANWNNGLVKDRSTKDSPASIAAVGFGIPSWAIGAEHGWISRKKAASITLIALNFFLHSEQSTDALATGYKGFYYHFIDMNTGKRFWECELSSIDTGLLLAGVIFARQFYNRNNPQEKEIRTAADSLLNRVDWNFFTLPDEGKYANTISMSWMPEKGLADHGWVGYNEALILYIIAAGDGMKDAANGYKHWLESYKWEEPYKGLAHVVFPPLFGHQFTQMYVDLRGIADSYMIKKKLDYFENSRRATLSQRLYSIQDPHGWKGYDSLTWGITACDGPGETYNYDDKKFLGYAGRGASGPEYNYFDDGTIAPSAACGSILFAPSIVIPSLIHMFDKYGSKGLWGRYGFVDAFNPTVNWYDKDCVGIDEGPIVLMIENFRNGLVWKYVMKDSVIKNGLKVLGFIKLGK